MLILTQNKNMIVNLNNVNSITEYYCEPTRYEIDVHFANGNYATLGEYKTEERALEVLANISERAGAISVHKMPEE